MITAPPREHGRRPGHAHESQSDPVAEGVSKVKAVVLLVVAVLLGIGLLRVDRPGHPANAAAAVSTTSTTTTTTTTAPTTQPSATVKVLVANGGTVSGAATFFTDKLSTLGWGTLNPTTTTSAAPASAVYYVAGQQAAASSIASALGLQPSVVQPLSSSVSVAGGVAGASVVLVAGPDLASQVTAGGS
ncbi:MAG: LytR C-terminal domain-containing protein [Acidimicrobiales bacterium]